jgi:hypothetical protein
MLEAFPSPQRFTDYQCLFAQEREAENERTRSVEDDFIRLQILKGINPETTREIEVLQDEIKRRRRGKSKNAKPAPSAPDEKVERLRILEMQPKLSHMVALSKSAVVERNKLENVESIVHQMTKPVKWSTRRGSFLVHTPQTLQARHLQQVLRDLQCHVPGECIATLHSPT